MNNRRKIKQRRSRQRTLSSPRRSFSANCCSQILYLLTCCFCRPRRFKSKEHGSRPQDPKQDIDTCFEKIERINSERAEASNDVALRMVVTHRAQERDHWTNEVQTGRTKVSDTGFMSVIPKSTILILQQPRSFASSAARVVAITKLLSSSKTISDLALGIMSTPQRLILVFGKRKTVQRTEMRSRFFERQGAKAISSAPSNATTRSDRTYRTGETTNTTVAKTSKLTGQKTRLFRNKVMFLSPCESSYEGPQPDFIPDARLAGALKCDCGWFARLPNKTAEVVYNNVLNLIDDSVRIVLIERQGQLKGATKIAKLEQVKEISTQKMPQTTKHNSVVRPGLLRASPQAGVEMKRSMELTKPGIGQEMILRTQLQRPSGLATCIMSVSHQQTWDMIRQMMESRSTRRPMQRIRMRQRFFDPQEAKEISSTNNSKHSLDTRTAIATSSQSTETQIRPFMNQIEAVVFNNVISLIDRSVNIVLIERLDAQNEFGGNSRIAQSSNIHEIQSQAEHMPKTELARPQNNQTNQQIQVLVARYPPSTIKAHLATKIGIDYYESAQMDEDVSEFISDVIKHSVAILTNARKMEARDCHSSDDQMAATDFSDKADTTDNESDGSATSYCQNVHYSDDFESSSTESIPEEIENVSSGDEVFEFIPERFGDSNMQMAIEGQASSSQNMQVAVDTDRMSMAFINGYQKNGATDDRHCGAAIWQDFQNATCSTISTRKPGNKAVEILHKGGDNRHAATISMGQFKIYVSDSVRRVLQDVIGRLPRGFVASAAELLATSDLFSSQEISDLALFIISTPRIRQNITGTMTERRRFVDPQHNASTTISMCLDGDYTVGRKREASSIEANVDEKNRQQNAVGYESEISCDYSDDFDSSDSSIPEKIECASSGDEVEEFVPEMLSVSKQLIGMEGGTFNTHDTKQESTSQYAWGKDHPSVRDACNDESPDSRCSSPNCEEYYGDSESINDATNMTALTKRRRRTSTMKTRKAFSLPAVNECQDTTNETEKIKTSPLHQLMVRGIISKHHPQPASTSTPNNEEHSENVARMKELTSMQQEIDNDLLEIDRKIKRKRSGLSPADIILKKHFEKTRALSNETGIFLTSLMEEPDYFEGTSDPCFSFGKYHHSTDVTAEGTKSEGPSTMATVSYDIDDSEGKIDATEHAIDETNVFSRLSRYK